jgi:hypothetical protein
MPTPTYTPLATVTLGSSASSVTFSSIPATYRDLILVVNGQTTGDANAQIRVNGDTGSNYSGVVMRQDATSQSGTFGQFYATWNTFVGSTRFVSIVNFMDYSATDKHKTVLTRSTYVRATAGNPLGPEAQAARWANTSAITTILLLLSANNYAAGTTFSLYGVIA